MDCRIVGLSAGGCVGSMSVHNFDSVEFAAGPHLPWFLRVYGVTALEGVCSSLIRPSVTRIQLVTRLLRLSPFVISELSPSST